MIEIVITVFILHSMKKYVTFDNFSFFFFFCKAYKVSHSHKKIITIVLFINFEVFKVKGISFFINTGIDAFYTLYFMFIFTLLCFYTSKH